MNRLFVVLFIFFVYACGNQPQVKRVRLAGEAQGTYYSITYYDSLQRDFQPQIDSLLRAFDQSVSLWVPHSILSKVNRNEDVTLDKYFTDNFNLSMQVAEETDGAFDPTVGSLVRAWGFGFDASRKVDSLIVDSILAFTGCDKVSIVDGKFVKKDERTTIDFNAIAQGYSVDVVGDFLGSEGVENYLVDIGGEVKARGSKPDGSFWKIGIEKPAKHKNDDRELKEVIVLKDKSVATSGSYRKFYEKDGVRYSHTIDPKTGYPVQHSLLSVSVVADNTALADAYATSFMVMGLEKSRQFLKNHPELDAFFIYADDKGNYRTYATEGFKKYVREEY
jgi:thiamine biosynthesis lipoprotein